MHAFGYERHLADVVLPCGSALEHLGRVNVADDVVNGVLVDDDLGEAGLDKYAHELLGRGALVDSLYLGAVYHAVADAEVGEVERILEDLDLGVDILGAIALLDARLDEVVKVHLGEGLGGALLVELDAKEAHDHSGTGGSKL